MLRRVFAILVFVVLLCSLDTQMTLADRQPQPDHILVGRVYVGGVVLTSDDTDYTISIRIEELGNQVMDSYTMGDDPGAGDQYYLVVRMSGAPREEGCAMTGDTAHIYVNDILITQDPYIIGSPGAFVPLDIYVTTDNLIVTDLSAAPGAVGNTIVLEWTAPSGITEECTYIIKYNTVPITESNWEQSLDVNVESTPGPAGSTESRTATVPYPGVTYYFAIRTQDAQSEISDVSDNGSAQAVGVYLHAGWNLVSFISSSVMSIEDAMSSISGKYSSVWAYDASTVSWLRYIVNGPSFLNNLTEMGPGYGYWVLVTEDCTWNPGGGGASASPAMTMRKPPFILYGKVDKSISPWIHEPMEPNIGNPALSVSLKVGDVEAGSYTLGSNPRYQDYYVLEIPVNDLFREGNSARIYANGTLAAGNAIELGRIGTIRRYDILHMRALADTNLLQNYPNPFNPDTWIPYTLADDMYVTIRIYNISGQPVRTLDLGRKPMGFYATKEKAAHWDGRNESGEEISSGVYFYTIQAGDFTTTKKMVIAR